MSSMLYWRRSCFAKLGSFPTFRPMTRYFKRNRHTETFTGLNNPVRVASKLSWQGGDDVYGAGQRDVATLYEYWAFLSLQSNSRPYWILRLILLGLLSCDSTA